MELKDLKSKVEKIIIDLKDNGKYPKENNHIDYKKELSIKEGDSELEIFLKNFSKDIISFSNADGGIILIGIKENKATGLHDDLGLNKSNLDIFSKIDLNDVSQKFVKIIKTGISIDLQQFQISTRKFYYLIIQKSNNTLVPINDFSDYKILKGAIYYRASGKTEQANSSTPEFNRFLQIKANEKSKEFMEIWSKLLPEMVDINPREVLIVNPVQDKVYGFNNKDKTLSGSSIEIEKSDDGVFNIILNAISAGEIGKITDNEGKPIYKLVGEFYKSKEHIMIGSLKKAILNLTKYKFTSLHLKKAIHYLGWVKTEKFVVINPPDNTIISKYSKYIWIETLDEISKRRKIYFSPEAIPELVKVIDNHKLHIKLFNKNLENK
jgi:hypothetical protein